MNVLTYIPALLVGALLSIAISATVQAQQTKVYIIEITGEVDLGLAPYVERAFEEAKESKAQAVVLHINTFGGRVDVATQVKDAILNATMPTIAFIDKRAISAGALIALSAKKIVMVPGASIGAATPVYETGDKAPEKVVSYMRGEMRATAEKNGRDPKVAEAMVDESLMLEDSTYKKHGQLLTLTTDEAIALNYCDLEAESIQSALIALGYTEPTIINTEMSWSESLVRFLTSPFVSSLLIMLGLGGLFFAIKTGHFGTIAGVGITSIALFFGAQYIADLASAIEVLMFVTGIVLIALEIFVIPGFGIAGISGGVLLVASLFLALIGNFDLVSFNSLSVPLYTLAASFIGLAILVALMFKYIPTSSAFSKFVLNNQQYASDGYVATPVHNEYVGQVAQALTTLRPAGVALLGSERIDVVTEGGYVNAGEQVQIIGVEGRKIIVRRVEHETETTV